REFGECPIVADAGYRCIELLVVSLHRQASRVVTTTAWHIPSFERTGRIEVVFVALKTRRARGQFHLDVFQRNLISARSNGGGYSIRSRSRLCLLAWWRFLAIPSR